MKMDQDEFQKLDLEVADLRQERRISEFALIELRQENRVLRTRLENAIEEAIYLRHKVEHIYALSRLALREEPEEKNLDNMGKEAW
tara:strand:- start:468 stop:725 length:258 start_codon:yes stop_codon:yes gene_type:complete